MNSGGLGGTGDHSIKQWSVAAAQFHVKPPDRQQNNRVKKFRDIKACAAESLNMTPYVEVQWIGSKNHHDFALMDTGAQWTLISFDKLTPEEKKCVTATTVSGQGVSGEKIPILGEIWRDVQIGNSVFRSQRFVVVDKMICPIILGMDLWARAQELSFDFTLKTLTINNDGVKIQLSGNPYRETERQSKRDETNPCEVLVAESISIPPRSEMVVACFVPRMEKGRDYLVEPISSEESWVGTPYGIVEGQADGKIHLKVSNLGDENATLGQGDCIAAVSPDQWVINSTSGNIFASQSHSKTMEWNKMISSDLDLNKKTQLTQLLKGYSSSFYKGGELPIVRVGVEHTVRLKEDSTPTACKPRRLSKDLADEVREHIDKLQKMGVIRESNSVWASPVVCARRNDGSLRLVIDYRLTNVKSVTATLHPIPIIDDLLDRLGQAKYFGTIDAKSGYHQMPLKKGDSEITAFVVPWGHYEFADRTPFGLKGAGYSFQRMMSEVLGSSNYIEALCYLDDILIWGETWEIFIKRLRKVMDKIKKAGLALSPEKCLFGMKEVSYLGCTIKQGMVKINEQRVEQLRAISRPTTVRDLRKALGAFAYVQRWLPGLAEVYKSLYNAVSGKPYERLVWTKEMVTDFDKIKQMIADAVALSLPDMEKKFTLVTDCSNIAAGAMLAQASDELPGYLKPVAFYHHALAPSEQKYSATEKELLAVVLAIKKFRVYLGRDFDLITDHQSLAWLKSLNPENEVGRRGRWLDLIQQFALNIIPKKGRSPEMSIADFLSRVRCDGSCKPSVMTDEEESDRIMVAAGDSAEEVRVERNRLIEAQREDKDLKVIMDALSEDRDLNIGNSDSSNWRIPSSAATLEVKNIWKYRDRLFMDADHILRIKFNGGRRNESHPFGVTEKNRIVVPVSCKDMILKLVHCSASAAHMGVNRTWTRARNNFWWVGMKDDVEEFVANCELCGRNKHMNHPNKAPAIMMPLPASPLDETMIDFVGPFQAARTHRYRYVLQIQDVLSRFLVFVPCTDSTAKTAADAMISRWLCLFGMPEIIRSDRGKHFVAELFEELCSQLGIKHKLGAPEHPESQGQVERQNQLINQVRCLCENDPETWPEAIAKVQFSHNASVNAGTGFSPSKLLFGKTLQVPDDLIAKETSEKKSISPAELVERDEEERRLCMEEAKNNIAADRVKRNETKQSKAEPYQVGDVVRYKLNDDVRSRCHGGKIAPRYSEPYRIVKVKKNNFTYDIRPVDGSSRGRPKVRHFNQLKTVQRSGASHQTHTDSEECDETGAGSEEEVLETARSDQEMDDEGAMTAEEQDSTTHQEPSQIPPSIGTRWSNRTRRKTSFLQADGSKKTYSSSSS